MKKFAIIFFVLTLILYKIFFGDSTEKKLLILNNESLVLAFGDSITAGFGVSHEQNYPYILSQLLNTKVINEGISGEISAQGLERLPRVLSQTKPTLVILCYGGNDILRKYDLSITKNNIAKMIEIIEESGAKVLLVGVPQPQGIFVKVAKFYDELAKKYSLVYDRETIKKIIESPSLKVDQIHPNEDGHKLLAKNLNDLIHDSFAIQNR